MPDETPIDPKLRDLAIEACKRHDKIESAINYVLRKLEDDPNLKQRLLTEIIACAIRQNIHAVRHTNLTAVKWSNRCTRGAAAVAIAGRVKAASLLDTWIMPDGRRLGDFKGTELQPLAANEANLAAGHEANSAFYFKLAKLAGDNKVRSAVDADRARAIWDAIRERRVEAA
jgi:hypothetical protein